MTIVKRRQAGRWSIRSDEDLTQKAYRDGLWVKTTLADSLASAASETPDRVLLVDGDMSLTASQLLARARLLAAAMQSRMPQGSVISFMLPNWHEAAVIYHAATMAGMVANPVLPSLRDHDLRFILADADTRMIFIPDQFRGYGYADMLRRVLPDMEAPPEAVLVRGEAGDLTSFNNLLEENGTLLLPDISPDDVRMLMYTSGTTGRPKGVLHTHNSLHALLMQIGEHWLVEPGDSFLVPSPISHIGGSIYAFEAPLLLGSRAVLMDKWDASAAVPIMLAERISHMAGATPFLQQLLDAARAAETRLPDLKVFICGGASVPPSLIIEACNHFEKARVSRVYGSTEVPVTTVGSLTERGMAEAADTDGRPGIAQVILGEANEIRAYGPQMLAGYLHVEDEAAAFDEQGFYRTGDQGEFTATGHLVVTGRIKDLIIRNGENIAPKEIEDLLVNHPDIAEIAIVGIADPRTGEKACAVIVPCEGKEPTVSDLAKFLSGFGVAKFKYPERVELREALPKNEAGKVLKHQLRDELSSA
ncbi:AMP-binding protein [Sphingorhabdus sp. M41]|uniref:AMP-binding protein n=1 Tax=Sphingorhabdus sp. M41 TaxID=1806885 RepID=UPI000B21EEFD|nr:AMP-binding protein [Sphingorhabdus sp. M41]